MDLSFRLFRGILKFGAPITLVLFPLVMMYGEVRPWPEAAVALSQYQGQKAVMVGFNQRFQGGRHLQSRSYVLLPSAIHDPKAVTLTKADDEPVLLHEARYGAIYFSLWVMFDIGVTWWFWFRSEKGGVT